MDFQLMIAQEIVKGLGSAFSDESMMAAEIREMLEVPPDQAMGDFAFPCFRLAKGLRKAPPMISDALQAVIEAPWLARVESVKGYLNFFVDQSAFAKEVLEAAHAQGVRYGAGDEGAGKTILIDYSSINIAKKFHIGHLSTTMIGNALYKMYNFLGYQCVGINHLGDWGTQFGKMVCAYKKWGDRETVERGGVDEMIKLYVRFDKESAEDPALADEGRAWFKKIEDGDPEAMEIFNWFKAVTLKYAEGIYDMLGVKFDSYAGEAFYNDKMGRVIDELRAKNLLVESDGAQVVDLEAYNMPPCLIIKKDGATLYATRDLTAALYRKDTYDFTRCLYVVAYQQDLHFRQVFKVLDLMGYEWYRDMEHVSYGMVSFEGQALSTRKGHVVYLEDLLNQAVEKARAIVEEKSPGLANKDEVARQVGVGAVVFFDLYNNRIKDIDFWWDRALNFEGETGPYVQYTHARCCSVLRKAKEAGVVAGACDYGSLADDEARATVKLVSDFPALVRGAVERSEPSLVTRYCVDLAQAYNKFYFEHRILGEEQGVESARLMLTEVVRNTLKTALGLIGIEAPERM